jgi:hypothetical protein
MISCQVWIVSEFCVVDAKDESQDQAKLLLIA